LTLLTRRSRASRPRAGAIARVLRLTGLAVVVAVLTSGCKLSTFGLPHPITPQGERVASIWTGSWIAAFAVGAGVWGLIFVAVVRFRKRSDELPSQVRYNLPVEVLYTVVPFIIVAALFYFTARDESYLDRTTAHPAVTIGVIGFRWNWQFRYIDANDPNKVVGQVTGRPGEPAQLVLPTDRSIRFIETSPDVIHSFWVPEFLFKRDVVPGRTNQFEISKITRTGTFVGRCAELCGTDHDRMNFQVKVVPPAEYDAMLQRLQSQAAAGPNSTVGSRS